MEMYTRESDEGVKHRLEEMKVRRPYYDNGLRVIREKTEYLVCDFGRYIAAHQEVIFYLIPGSFHSNGSFRKLGITVKIDSGKITKMLLTILKQAGEIKDDFRRGLYMKREIP
ncbi:hypothetical protein Tco_1332147 [Tanacetum coccineum]